jgi:poly-gamma-glutamate synthesis protein (capsule biosynthesis protein)
MMNDAGCGVDATVFVSGDFCPVAAPLNDMLKTDAARSVFSDLYDVIQKADVSITNLECPLTLSDEAIVKIGPHLKAHPEVGRVLTDAGFDVVTLANNHIYDFGQRGLCDTLETLRRCGLSHVGAGRDLEEARRTFYLEVRGIRLAIVNVAEIEFSCANSEHGGAHPMHDIDTSLCIREARRHADHVLLIVHGGHEFHPYPSPETLKRYRFYADRGASAVIAHHTHCMGGYEVHGGVPIFYSLGNLFFPCRGSVPQLWYEGYAVLLTVSKAALSFEIVPYEQCKEGSLSIGRARSGELLEAIHRISDALSSDAAIAEQWQAYAAGLSSFYLAQISGVGQYRAMVFEKLGILQWLYRRSQLRTVRQLLRCEAHREAARYVLSAYLE